MSFIEKTEIIKHPHSNSSSINIHILDSFLQTSGEQIVKEIVKNIIDSLAEDYIKKNSAEILSKLDQNIIANMASLELGKRAVKIAEQKI